MKHRFITSVLVAAAVAGAAPVVAASPAFAAWDGCTVSGYACNYKNANGSSGGVKAFSGQDLNYSDNNFDGCSLNCGVNDATSSIWNRESYTNRFTTDSSGMGNPLDIGGGSSVSSLSGVYNDELSSHYQV